MVSHSISVVCRYEGSTYEKIPAHRAMLSRHCGGGVLGPGGGGDNGLKER